MITALPGMPSACRGRCSAGADPMYGARAVPALCALIPFLLSAGVRAAGLPQEAWIMPGADESLLVDIAHDGERWIVVGERGHILVSGDAETWTQVEAPTRVLLTAVALDGQGSGFAVGHDATILRSRDDGATWERVYHAPQEQAPFLDVVAAGNEKVVAVGAYGLYAESSDAGESWDVRTLEPEQAGGAAGGEQSGGEELSYDLHLNDIAIAGDGRWYIAAEAGAVYRSGDQGETWLRLASPYEGSFFGVLPMEKERVLVFGLQGRLFESYDAGASWTAIDTGTDAALSSALPLPNGGALVVGYAGVVLSGIDGSGSPTLAELTNRPAVSDAYRFDNGDLLTVGEGGIRRWPADTVMGR